MSDNSGAKDHCDSPVEETFMRWPFQVSSDGQTRADSMIPEVAGYRNPGPTKNLRGVEANTNESKGVPSYPPLKATIDHHGEDAPPAPLELEECT